MHLYRLLRWAVGFLSAAAVAAAANPDYDFGIDADALNRRQDPSGPIIVGRLPYAANGSVPLRPELRELKADQYRWDLFILALSMSQSASQDDPLSWYQIAGIHGVPFTMWNGVEPQQLYKLANTISRMFANSTERMLYQQAASEFRIPYWDWASPAPPGESFFPAMLMEPVISQYGPNGLQTIRNPLFSYSFHPLDEEAFIWDPLKQWNETKRAPDMSVSVESPPSMNDQVDKALLSKLPEIQQRLYALFSNYHDFNSFGNKGWAVSQNLTTLDSIEALHDIIHIYGGSRGHMTYVPLSSFDPLFLLHHTMVDRLIAMWQLLNPTAWITPMAAGETSYTSLAGTIQNSSTPLTPFLASADGQFWTSDMSRSTETFGYAYAATRIPFGVSRRRHRESLIRKINRWLGGSSAMGLRSKATWPSQAWRPEGSHHIFQASDNAIGSLGFRPYIKVDAPSPPISRIVRKGHYTEWMANVHVNMDASDDSFAVHFFIGEPPKHARDWISAPNLAGSVGFFAMRMMTVQGSKMSGAVPLTSALMKLVASRSLRNLEPDMVVPFLRKALRFRVLKTTDDCEADPTTMVGLDVSISSSDVRLPHHDAELPRWGEMVEQIHIWP
ncbi:Tyrosinase [Escovopsis weberi]|uniref:Tyrosinase n=1 Tax=Escovopsis weberi TaxID=150374 RepID=A0A0M8MUF9_ESCWE|nr:Tyrosinase [Escovopsis weberi]